MNEELIFKAPIGDYYIKLVVRDGENGKTAYINYIHTDYKYYKMLMALLRQSVDSLKDKQVTHIIQSVYVDEYNEQLRGRTSWVIMKTYHDNSCDIICPIDDFLENFGVGIGIGIGI